LLGASTHACTTSVGPPVNHVDPPHVATALGLGSAPAAPFVVIEVLAVPTLHACRMPQRALPPEYLGLCSTVQPNWPAVSNCPGWMLLDRTALASALSISVDIQRLGPWCSHCSRSSCSATRLALAPCMLATKEQEASRKPQEAELTSQGSHCCLLSGTYHVRNSRV
jgi:hypothetical protein